MKKETEIKCLEEEIRQYITVMPTIIKNLNVNQKLVDLIAQKVNFLLKKTYDVGNTITRDVVSLCENDISFLIEMENCYKGKERIIEKVYNYVSSDNIDISEAIDKIEDVLRYTYIIINADDYLNKIAEYLHKLELLGYKVYDFLNFWGNEFYQGINVLLEYKGVKLEIQFHTINSYDIKEGYTREPYIVARNILSDKEMVDKANIVRSHYQKKVNVPTGAIGFQYRK